ncbi:hypothetical protein FRB90_002126 [Tulasnella sp. 427]|nr:hypothetical protein FRB90_002126 [Tulasnella sp. 427]
MLQTLPQTVWNDTVYTPRSAAGRPFKYIEVSSTAARNGVVHPDFDFKDTNVIIAVTGCPVVNLPPEVPLFDPDQPPPGPESEEEEFDPEPKPIKATTWFKCHTFQIRRHSEVLARIMDTQERDGVEIVDGLPVISLDDDPRDILNLLNFIYNSDIVPALPFRQSTFETLSSILRLTPKYSLRRITPLAKRRLQEEWPRDIEEWDRNERQFDAMGEWNAYVRQAEESSRDGHPGEEVDVVEPCSVIRLGTDHGLVDILPAAFYDLSRTSPIYDRKGRGRTDMIGYQRARSHWMDGGRSANRALLTPIEFGKLCAGKGAIRQWVADIMTSGWSSEHLVSCPQLDWECAGKPEDWKAYWSQEIEPPMLDLLQEDGMDVLSWLKGIQADVAGDARLCNSCRARIAHSINQARRDFWDCLPQFFCLKRPSFWNGEWTDEVLSYDSEPDITCY